MCCWQSKHETPRILFSLPPSLRPNTHLGHHLNIPENHHIWRAKGNIVFPRLRSPLAGMHKNVEEKNYARFKYFIYILSLTGIETYQLFQLIIGELKALLAAIPVSFVAESAGGEEVLVVARKVGGSRKVWVACIVTGCHLPPSLVTLIHRVPPDIAEEIIRTHSTKVMPILFVSYYLIVQTVQTPSPGGAPCPDCCLMLPPCTQVLPFCIMPGPTISSSTSSIPASNWLLTSNCMSR